MLTNTRDTFRGHSTSPFHILGIVSSCAIETLSLRCAVLLIFDFKKCRDLEIQVRGHSRSLKVAPFDRLCMVSEINGDFRRKSPNFPPHRMYLMPPLKGFPLEFGISTSGPKSLNDGATRWLKKF